MFIIYPIYSQVRPSQRNLHISPRFFPFGFSPAGGEGCRGAVRRQDLMQHPKGLEAMHLMGD